MKKNSIKIIALLAVAAIGIFALYKSKKSDTISESVVEKENDLETLLSKATVENPFSFKPKSENDSLSTQYVFNGKIFTKQLMGPNVRTVPSEISKEEFVEAYNEYLL